MSQCVKVTEMNNTEHMGNDNDTAHQLQEFLQDTVMSDKWWNDGISDEELVEAMAVIEAQMESSTDVNIDIMDDTDSRCDDGASFDQLLDFLFEDSINDI